MRVAGCLVALTVATGLAGCGGTHRKPGAAAPAPARPQAAAPLALLLPASTGGPTSCTVYESGFATQVVFDSESLNVTGECQAWTSRQPGAGYLWSYQPTDIAIDATAIPQCDLRDPSGRVTAIVIEDTGFAPASSAERASTASACARLALAGWIRGHVS
ncbi:MAG TPA: hypothetical protein VMD09_15550 [Solirubrobacteraceae bacterium]|nr:hypothetical protein [Solirubrobacteraceae bacterium]